MTAKRPRKRLGRLAFRVVLMLLLGLFLGASIYSINARLLTRDPLPMPFGVGVCVVLSGSMEPTLSVNDLVIIRRAEDYQVGDVVVFQSGGSLVIHRIVQRGDGLIVTQGDANNTPDEPVELSAVRGRMAAAVPGLGAAVEFLRSGPGIAVVIALAVVLLELSRRRERDADDRQMDAIKEEIRQLKAQDKDDSGDEG